MANPNPKTDHLTHKFTRKEQSMGAKRSAEVRREKKELVKTAKIILEQALKESVTDKKTGRTFTAKEAMLLGLMNRAIKNNDLSAIRLVLEIIGENPNNPTIDITGFNITVADKRAKEALEDL